MNVSRKSTERFSLRKCLRADVNRYYSLSGAPPPSAFVVVGLLLTPRIMPVFLCRAAYWCYTHRLSAFGKLFSLTNFVVFGIEIAVRCQIGEGLVLPHTQGTVIGANSIGINCTIFQGVTLGAKKADWGYDPLLRPILGDNITVGAGAKVLGGIQIGSFSVIGANAVVLQSVPERCTAVGVPARNVQQEP